MLNNDHLHNVVAIVMGFVQPNNYYGRDEAIAFVAMYVISLE